MNWVVYRHTSPSGKVYIGITSDVNKRWANNGLKYCCKNTTFCRAIRKYGWTNFKHEILFSDLTKEEACLKEIELIKQYKLLGISYNESNGGEGYSGKQKEEHIKARVEGKARNSSYYLLLFDNNFNCSLFRTIAEAAKSIGVKSNVVSHVLQQPLGYTVKGYYPIKVDRDKPFDIDSIVSTLKEAAANKHKMPEVKEESRIKSSIAHKLTYAAMTESERRGVCGHPRNSMYYTRVALVYDEIPVQVFNSIGEAAAFLKINISNVYRSLKRGTRVRGFHVKKFTNE